jgi:hypothetical protein
LQTNRLKNGILGVVSAALLATMALGLSSCSSGGEDDYKVPADTASQPDAPNMGTPPAGTLDPQTGQPSANPGGGLPMPGNKKSGG